MPDHNHNSFVLDGVPCPYCTVPLLKPLTVIAPSTTECTPDLSTLEARLSKLERLVMIDDVEVTEGMWGWYEASDFGDHPSPSMKDALADAHERRTDVILKRLSALERTVGNLCHTFSRDREEFIGQLRQLDDAIGVINNRLKALEEQGGDPNPLAYGQDTSPEWDTTSLEHTQAACGWNCYGVADLIKYGLVDKNGAVDCTKDAPEHTHSDRLAVWADIKAWLWRRMPCFDRCRPWSLFGHYIYLADDGKGACLPLGQRLARVLVYLSPRHHSPQHLPSGRSAGGDR
jgi:hypothetical protein